MNNPKILIVDDEPFNVDYLEQELAEKEYDTISAVNGLDALDKLRSGQPDLVLLDIMMPVMDGFEVLTRLKADAATRNTPVIIISANSDLQNVVKGIQLGAEDYLPKPFEPVLLHARISSSLDKKRLHDLEQLYLKSLEKEMDIARGIQRGFLPAELPRSEGWEIAAYFKAAREVAGDFYDSFLLPDGNLACVVGDVCDKGVGAALFMTLFRSLVRAAATTTLPGSSMEIAGISPAERLNHVIPFTNRYITETHSDANMFATLFMCIFNLQSGALTYVNCGNEPPLILRNGVETAVLQPTGPVVGLFPEAKFEVRDAVLEQGDLLLAFTDGIPDSRNPDNEFFGRQHIAAAIRDASSPAGVVVEDIEMMLNRFIGTAEPYDDITLMAVRRTL